MWATPYYRLIICFILPAFFALSGFLVAGSLERCKTVAGFLYLRAIRIFPALIIEVLISALLLGPLMTNLTLHDYFHSRKFYGYLLNCVGYIHFSLPGVFSSNPYPNVVNGQLWTVPFELDCYIFLALLAIIGVTRNRGIFSIVVIGLLLYTGLQYFIDIYQGAQTGPTMSLTGHQLVVCFLGGVLFYNLRFIIPHSPMLAAISVVLSWACFLVPDAIYFAPLPVVYVTIYLGVMNPQLPKILRSGDYSYGIFLYGFPIQQTVASGLVPLNGFITLSLALPLSILAAVISWHAWEKHVMNLRKFRPLVDRVFYFTRTDLAEAFLFRALGRQRQSLDS